MYESLRDLGYSNLCLLAAKDSAAKRRSDSSEALFEAAWRAEDWNIDLSVAGDEERNEQPGFHSCLYRAIRELHQVVSSGGPKVTGGLDGVLKHVTLARKRTVRDMFEQDLQSTKQSRSLLARLQLCEDLHEYAALLLNGTTAKVSAFRAEEDPVAPLVDKWQCRARAQRQLFALSEPGACLQRVLLSVSGRERALSDLLCLAAKAASKCGNLAYAQSAMHRLQLRGASFLGPGEWCVRAAKLMWLNGQRDKAVGFLRHLEGALRPATTLHDTRLLSQTLAVNASWLSASRSEGWREIKKMLSESVDLLRKAPEICEERAKAHFKLASFMDTMYSREQVREILAQLFLFGDVPCHGQLRRALCSWMMMPRSSRCSGK